MTEYNHAGSPEIPVVFSEKCPIFGYLSEGKPQRCWKSNPSSPKLEEFNSRSSAGDTHGTALIWAD
jgi:hypothetical protein